ncbi:MAG: hypothetical protein H7X99_05445 [Saprospiraceae bacterium]|nr:hypothetical protein [Saprospiraceae bacterium]
MNFGKNISIVSLIVILNSLNLLNLSGSNNFPSIPLDPQNSDINGLVWFDQNADGIIDMSEPVLGGVPVFLITCSGQFISSTITLVNGYYSFDDIPDGGYKVFFNKSGLPSNYVFTFLGNNTDNSSQANGYTLCSLTNDDTYVFNAGLTVLSSVGDLVWDDMNGNGLQDNGEPGIDNAIVSLFDENDNLIAQTSTNALGFYFFQHVFPGNYYLHFDISSSLSQTVHVLSDLNLNSDLSGANGENTTSDFTVIAGFNINNIDAGFYVCAQICGTLYYDSNFNDNFNTGENGINHLKVNLWQIGLNDTTIYAFNYTSVKPGSPSDDGYFSFCVPPGKYFIEVVIPPGVDLLAGIPFVGSNPFIYNHISHDFGHNTTYNFEVVSGDSFCYLNNGFYCESSIGNKIWMDTNMNGIQDNGEAGVGNVLVYLYDESYNQLDSAFTDDNGNYLFDGLRDGNYYIHCIINDDLVFTSPFCESGSMPDMDSNIDGSYGEGTSAIIQLGNCEKLNNIDGGIGFLPLPVSWGNISVKRSGSVNILMWNVYSEFNVKEYTISRRKVDYGDFIPIGNINGENKSSGANYSFEDHHILAAESYYYMVKVTDFDGVESNSKIVMAAGEPEKLNFVISPNPANDKIDITIPDLSEINHVIVIIYTAEGKKAGQHTMTDNSKLTIGTDTYPEGVYSMMFYNGTNILDKKNLVINR